MLFYIPYPIPYPGVQFGIGYPYPSDSLKPDMDSLKRIRRRIRCGNYPIRLHIYESSSFSTPTFYDLRGDEDIPNGYPVVWVPGARDDYSPIVN